MWKLPRSSVFVWILVCLAGLISTLELIALTSAHNPDTASNSIIAAIFICIFFILGSIISILWYSIRYFLILKSIPPKPIVSIRQGFLLSAAITLCLFMNSLNIMRWLDVVPLVTAIVLIEFFMQADKRPRATLKYGE